MHYLYRITNIENKKVYIGQTNNPVLRWSQHKSNAKYDRGQQVITRAISKYGVDKFEFEVIATCLTQIGADETESLIIIQYDSRNPMKGYNVDVGGNTTPRTSEVLQKISEGLQKHYKMHNNWNKGGTLTKEWKENISKASMGKEGTNIGKTFNDDWRNNISKSLSGKPAISRRRFSEEVEKEICKRYVDQETSTYALAKQFNCQRTLISNILQRHKIATRKSNYIGHSNGKNIFSLQQEMEICKLYSAGNISRSELSRKFRCGKTTIRDILLKHNIKI